MTIQTLNGFLIYFSVSKDLALNLRVIWDFNTMLSFWVQFIEPYHWLLISGIKGLRLGLVGMCQVFIEPRQHSWKGSSKVFRWLEVPYVYQPALPCVFLLFSSLNH
jgi:hypothetical protein